MNQNASTLGFSAIAPDAVLMFDREVSLGVVPAGVRVAAREESENTYMIVFRSKDDEELAVASAIDFSNSVKGFDTEIHRHFDDQYAYAIVMVRPVRLK
jgi:hypothetical protein